MARVPTIAEEDAKRPNRERDCLVGERTRIVNRIKSTLARLCSAAIWIGSQRQSGCESGAAALA
jgi:hypothetical protein